MKRKSHDLGAPPVAVHDLATVLAEIDARHPDLRMREYDERGPRGVWAVDRLLEAVRRDLSVMTPQERAAADIHRYFWGYDAGGRVQVIHAPVRGTPHLQFEEEGSSTMGSIFDVLREREPSPVFEVVQRERSPIFDIVHPEPGVRPREERRPSPREWSPRQERAAPERRAAPPPPPAIDVARWFDLPDLWEKIRRARGREVFQADVAAYSKTGDYADAPLIEIAGKNQEYKVADFFGIPAADYERMRQDGTWDRAIGSLLKDVEKKLNEALPEEFPGFVEFSFDGDDRFGLFYFEGGD